MDRRGGVGGEAFDQALREEYVEFLLFVALVPFADALRRTKPLTLSQCTPPPKPSPRVVVELTGKGS